MIAELERGQQAWEFEQEGAATNQIKVNLGQFYGIEINDFAVAVARTALWIVELQANGETAAILQREVADLPLKMTPILCWRTRFAWTGGSCYLPKNARF